MSILINKDTKVISSHIKDNGYKLIEVWECERPKLKKVWFGWKFTPSYF